MTREEAKALKWFTVKTLDKEAVRLFESAIDKIYDDFESRICKNCRFYDNQFNLCLNDKIGTYVSVLDTKILLKVDADFGCNRFERRENDS